MIQSTYKPDLFKGATAVVTGGTSGIGASTAFYHAELGAKVYALGLKANLLEIKTGMNVEAIDTFQNFSRGIRIRCHGA